MTREPPLGGRGASRVVSWTLVGAQLALLVALVASGMRGSWGIAATALLAASGALAAWAVMTMGVRNLHPLPDVHPGATLRTRGAYRYLRHPMYSSLLLASLACVLSRPDTMTVGLALALALVLAAKSSREERMLCAAFPEYAEYRRRSWRFIPGLY